MRSPGNAVRLAVNFATVITLGASVAALRMRCAGCGVRFWFDPHRA